jgi:hypothetical protein
MITSLKINSAVPLLGGTEFGARGSYLYMTGSATGEIDPDAAAHAVIGDLHRAPRNARGKIEYRTDVVILRPADPAKGNGRLLYEVNNRGRKQLFNFLCDASTANGALALPSDVGNGFPLHHRLVRLGCNSPAGGCRHHHVGPHGAGKRKAHGQDHTR